MTNRFLILATSIAAVVASPLAAATPKPKLIIAVAVDQFSADLFAEYRQHFTGGLKLLSEGVVFPSGFQSHAATETCPGHSTILTGGHPARTGVIANSWIDLDAKRADKRIYCAEDESVPGSSAENYTASVVHLKVPTLGDRLKALSAQSRVVSVAGKDRAAIMMGGHKVDEMWWWEGRGFRSYADRPVPAVVSAINTQIDAMLGVAVAAPALPAVCAAKIAPVAVAPGKSVGSAPGTRDAGDARAFRTSPAFDAVTLDMAEGLLDSMKLGRGPAVDVLSIGLSATDYVGHSFGTAGPETCLQLLSLDQRIGLFLAKLKTSGVPFALVLTADHGGHDLPERNRERALPEASRVDHDLAPAMLDEAIARELGIEGFLLTGDGPMGDLYVSHDVPEADRPRVIAATKARLLANPKVAAVFTKDDFRGYQPSTAPVNEWSLLDRVAASYDPARSGDLVFLLKPYVTPIINPGAGYVATHGSAWDYDRRVPMLFWWPGIAGFEQPNPVATVDILPTLAALINLPVAPGEIDGRCLDLDGGPGDTCHP